MQYKYESNPNKLYRIVYDKTEDVANSNLPTLCEGDIVIIKSCETSGRKYWNDLHIAQYVVKVVKQLSKVKRHPRDSHSANVGYVPECMLEPYKI